MDWYDVERWRLESEIDRLSDLVGIPEDLRPRCEFRDDGARFIDFRYNGRLRCLSFSERGVTVERSTRDVSELMYWVISDALCRSGGTWAQRASALHALDPAWAERWCAELAGTIGPERRHEVPTLPPEEPFVLRSPRFRSPRPRRPAPAAVRPATRRPAGAGPRPAPLSAAFVSPPRSADSCDLCRKQRRTPKGFPRFRLLDR
ncbi:hypothetical protein SAMN05216371_5918 [Streptomyces sp. TLI_053]|uniref:hypothetical protein n=1 Tax=Streptomyces sp. TLI_053 TaxID=1855352 RepID=UPI00087A354C|nr:hypothetical protein [Streptomyces sp. TLI_053]SDT79063.1 hypothetical protein SAMN05216371_5918 [Streptomyces sp. TLI_053]